MRPSASWAGIWLAAVLLSTGSNVLAQPAPSSGRLDEAVKARKEANAALQESQKRVDQAADETDTLLTRYRSTLRQTESLKVYQDQVEKLIASQEREMEGLQTEIDEITVIGREVTPLMFRMLDSLETFVSLDMPFLPGERHERVNGLREIMARADVTDAEKYRRILEAYQIESEYGRTIEAYQGTLDVGGKPRTVDFLRFGRVALVYQTLDGSESGVWDRDAKTWVALGPEYKNSIRQGLRVARKQAAPDLLELPIPAAKVVQ